MAIVTPLETSAGERRRLALSSPATLENLGEIEVHNAADVQAAVERAGKAQIDWAALSVAERSRYLLKALQVLLARQDEVISTVISETGKPLSTLVEERIAAFPASGEINREIGDPDAALADLESHYGASAEAVEHVDGLSMDFGDWRFNLRKSNTEPVVRLNVEARGDIQLMHDKTDELLERIGGRA